MRKIMKKAVAFLLVRQLLTSGKGYASIPTDEKTSRQTPCLLEKTTINAPQTAWGSSLIPMEKQIALFVAVSKAF